MSKASDNWQELQWTTGDLMDEFAAFKANERELEDSRHPESGSPTETKSATRQRHPPDSEPRR